MKSSPPGVRTAMPPVLWALMFGNFVIATGVMVVPGTLNDLSSSLAVSIPVAGQLITVSGVVMCLCAPLLASAVATWDRRRLLALCMLWYGVLQLLSAVMPTFGSLLVVRALTVISPAIFTPQVAACMAFLVPAHQRGKAISLVFLGWSVASVLGVPLGAWIGGALGWRYAFAGVGLLSLASAVWVWRAMPRHIRPPAFSLASWRETLQSKPLMLCIAVTALYSSGQFVLFAYLAPYYKAMFDITPYQLSMMFGLFGLFGFIGNVWVSRHIDRLGPQRVVGLSIFSMALSFLLWSLGSTLLLCALVLVPWALGCFAANSAQQARISGMAPALASGAIALNTSAIYAGQAVGAATGGWLIGQGQMGVLHWVGLAGLLMSWWVSQAATRSLGLRSLKS